MTQRYDYVVVGAGSAGCAAAYRLAKNSDAQILLLEAGGRDNKLAMRMPIGFSSLLGEGPSNWGYRSEPEPHLDGLRVALPRGKVLGGCSTINGMVYIRGQREDYDGWAQAGNPGWAFEDVLPLFKRSEHHWNGASDYHGSGGPLNITPVTCKMPVGDAFIAAAEQAGIPRNTDFNGPVQEGVGYFDATIARGRRHSSARAFLRRGVKPSNLHVVTGFEAARLIVEGRRAVAVEGSFKGQHRRFDAGEEIVLCAGTFNSPKLLELSGIGQASRLAALDIPVRMDLPGVGEHLQDHANSYLYFATRGCDSYFEHIRSRRLPLTLLDYLVRRRGIFANPAAQIGAFLRLDPRASRPDTQIHFAAAAARADDTGKLTPIPGVCASICQLRPGSRGNVHIHSARPDQAPAIRFNYLSREEDQQFQLRALHKLRDIFAQPALADFLEAELPPLAGIESDEELLQAIRKNLESVHHPAGTCRMGTGDDAVVDPQLRVHGIEGLRVADASIMPTLISGNTHAASVMIGEKVAELMRE
ncbi:GMC family oxidoreductase [Halomonas sp. PR-M31]|uniref:GMC family oxidoreductase n=1 Tax=Halomonas sp. PR-M31 TaxID=1471202 RepID=UPI00065070B6|nr:GMC family oxidoreductase N-terminal domain-containing protein [Halomonas sp. PR-M31]